MHLLIDPQKNERRSRGPKGGSVRIRCLSPSFLQSGFSHASTLSAAHELSMAVGLPADIRNWAFTFGTFSIRHVSGFVTHGEPVCLSELSNFPVWC